MTSLSEDLLDALLDELQRWGAPVADVLAPGLDETAIDRIAAPLQLPLHPDIRTWFRWRNGTTTFHRFDSSVAFWRLSSLQQAVDQTLLLRELQLEGEEDLPHWWSPSWFALVDYEGKSDLAVECASSPLAGTVERFDADGSPHIPPIRLPSVSALVETWIAALRAGVWTSENRRWTTHPERIPAGVDSRFL